jgi:hypothetical protein
MFLMAAGYVNDIHSTEVWLPVGPCVLFREKDSKLCYQVK